MPGPKCDGGQHVYGDISRRHADCIRPLRRGSGGDPRQRRARVPQVQNHGAHRHRSVRALHGDQLRSPRPRRQRPGRAGVGPARGRGPRRLIDAAGGQASLWGYSSGSALALRAAAAGLPTEKLVLYEAPFKTDPTAKFPRDDYAARLEPLIEADDRIGAAKLFLRNVGMPGPVVTVMSVMPAFKRFGANGRTLMFDYLALGDENMHGSRLRAQEWATVTCPTLVVYGSKTYPSLKHASCSLADVLPNATLHELPGQKHAVKPNVITPVIAKFVAGLPLAA
ncbi:MAG: alpha/beta fold hydrolase [Solirubrobacterales bacterium]|nr:alpha/beta fold hydrolase [Solirubrobacterales bacterium]